MKSITIYMTLLILFVHFHTSVGPTPIYKNSYHSVLPVRIIAGINSDIAKSCKTEKLDYRVAQEKIGDTEESFIYKVEFATSAIDQGTIIIEEKHSGEVVLQKIECPGKSGQWYSYLNPTRNSRTNAGM